jgi:hypothetical protein
MSASPPTSPDRPGWLAPHEEFEPPAPRRAQPAAPEAGPAADASEEPSIPVTPMERVKAVAPGFKLHHLVGLETIAPVVLVILVALLGLGWYLSQHHP